MYILYKRVSKLKRLLLCIIIHLGCHLCQMYEKEYLLASDGAICG